MTVEQVVDKWLKASKPGFEYLIEFRGHTDTDGDDIVGLHHSTDEDIHKRTYAMMRKMFIQFGHEIVNGPGIDMFKEGMQIMIDEAAGD